MTNPVLLVRWHLRQRFPRPDPADQSARTEIVVRLRKAMIVVYLWMFAASAVLTYEVIAIRAETTRESHRAALDSRMNHLAASQAHAACRRAQIISPPLLKFYERTNALPPAALKAYRTTIPRSC